MRTYVAKGEEAEALKVGANWHVVDATIWFWAGWLAKSPDC